MALKREVDRVTSSIWTANAVLSLRRLLLVKTRGTSPNHGACQATVCSGRQAANLARQDSVPLMSAYCVQALNERFLHILHVSRPSHTDPHAHGNLEKDSVSGPLGLPPVPPATWAGGDWGTECKEEVEGPLM